MGLPRSTYYDGTTPTATLVIIEAFEGGMTRAEIARELGLSRRQIGTDYRGKMMTKKTIGNIRQVKKVQ